MTPEFAFDIITTRQAAAERDELDADLFAAEQKFGWAILAYHNSPTYENAEAVALLVSAWRAAREAAGIPDIQEDTRMATSYPEYTRGDQS